MMRFFIDASVLFSAAYSAKGHSRSLFILATAQAPPVRLVVSDDVLAETRRNLAYHVPEKLDTLDRLVSAVHFEIINPARRAVLGAARRVAFKDAPIVAAARKARVRALVTFDEKHLLNNLELPAYIRAPVIRPQAAIEMVTAGR
jgi:predicted nucleic acid-binding protein